MAINTEKTVSRAVRLACQNNPEDALELLKPCLNTAQFEKISSIIKGITDRLQAPHIEKAVMEILAAKIGPDQTQEQSSSASETIPGKVESDQNQTPEQQECIPAPRTDV